MPLGSTSRPECWREPGDGGILWSDMVDGFSRFNSPVPGRKPEGRDSFQNLIFDAGRSPTKCRAGKGGGCGTAAE